MREQGASPRPGGRPYRARSRPNSGWHPWPRRLGMAAAAETVAIHPGRSSGGDEMSANSSQFSSSGLTIAGVITAGIVIVIFGLVIWMARGPSKIKIKILGTEYSFEGSTWAGPCVVALGVAVMTAAFLLPGARLSTGIPTS